MAYWDSHKPGSKPSYQRFFAKSAILENPFIKLFFSIRLSNEIFLSRHISLCKAGKQPVTILDIGCGWGQNFARTKNAFFYGVDIKGFPREQALRKGYREALEYNDDKTIPYQSSFFDMIIMFNLTAHLPDQIFAGLLDESRRCARPGAVILIAAECNNAGLSYAFMNRFSSHRLTTMISAMDHKNFKNENEMDEFLSEHGLSIKHKETICGHFLPFIHYVAFFFGIAPYRQLRYLSIAVDMIISVLNSVADKLTINKSGKRFVVGYVCTFNG